MIWNTAIAPLRIGSRARSPTSPFLDSLRMGDQNRQIGRAPDKRRKPGCHTAALCELSICKS